MIPNNPIFNLSSAGVGTTTQIVSLNSKGLLVLVNIPVAAGGTTPTLQVTINGIVPDGSGATFPLLASAALDATTTGVTALTVFPGAATTTNLSANSIITSSVSITVVVGGTSPSVTATISIQGI